ncbi:DNA mismatch endonuclease (patch repair protein) [Streptacidiphilus sp. BW17]|uniref:very short patch repair endonuclease n=1 Tax=Streptacidiphilus sp. BW17 TaxID=3156274 RepID=UPI003510DB26
MSPTSDWTPPAGSWASSEGNRRSMLGNRGRDTSPERALRSLVHASGLRYRVSARPVPGIRRTADLVFGPTKVAIFIDGCFWHRCPEHFTAPKTNAQFWEEKISRNVARDRDTDARLQAEGWLVLRFWEHQAPGECAELIRAAVMRRRSEATSKGARRAKRR